jgi:hypothetical protein
VRFLAVPLAMPEWSSAAADGRFESAAGRLVLEQRSPVARLHAPVWIDLEPSRVGEPMTWRQLTVADTRQNLPTHRACGYRVQAGTKQWLVYRALDAVRNRSVLGCNLACEFLLGRIGRAVVRRLVACGGRVLVSDPVASADAISAIGAHAVPLPRLLTESDLVTLHCPSLPETKGMINASTLATAKPGLLLVNLSRGDLVDPDALVAALDSGRVGGAALDVFAPEPIPAGHPILGRSNVILAPHIASVSAAAVHRLRTTAAELAVAALAGGPLPSIVNGLAGPRDFSA